jgi:hypothetical protein
MNTPAELRIYYAVPGCVLPGCYGKDDHRLERIGTDCGAGAKGPLSGGLRAFANKRVTAKLRRFRALARQHSVGPSWAQNSPNMLNISD